MTRRKLKATHMERTIFGDASGGSLLNVVPAKGLGGRKVGALNCWEHAQPLLKFHTLGLGEEVHCAAWPPVVPHEGGPDLWSLSSDGESMWKRALRFRLLLFSSFDPVLFLLPPILFSLVSPSFSPSPSRHASIK